MSGRPDSNWGPLEPKSSALTGLRYAPNAKSIPESVSCVKEGQVQPAAPVTARNIVIARAIARRNLIRKAGIASGLRPFAMTHSILPTYRN